jgi:predicted amidohydrolase
MSQSVTAVGEPVSPERRRALLHDIRRALCVQNDEGDGMEVAVVQLRPEFGDIKGNIERIVELISSEDADLYVVPELALSGYLFASAAEARSLSQAPDGPEFDPIADVGRTKGAAVVLGFAERAGSELFNSSLLITPDGARTTYRKIQLFWGEKAVFRPGDRPPGTVDFGGTRLGMMICFDWIFPEVARSLALQGADVICHPSNLVLPYCQEAMVTRCIENRVFAMTANRVGTEERAGASLTFTGLSEIVAPSGEILARASGDREEVLVVTIDPLKAREKKITPTNDVLADRRPDLYTLDGPSARRTD